MNREDDQPLWDLLGKSVSPPASPFFARNILREIRQKEVEAVGSRWLSWRALGPLSGLAAVCALALHFFFSSSEPAREEIDLAQVMAEMNPQDYDEFFELDDLLAVDEGSLWSEDSIL